MAKGHLTALRHYTPMSSSRYADLEDFRSQSDGPFDREAPKVTTMDYLSDVRGGSGSGIDSASMSADGDGAQFVGDKYERMLAAEEYASLTMVRLRPVAVPVALAVVLVVVVVVVRVVLVVVVVHLLAVMMPLLTLSLSPSCRCWRSGRLSRRVGTSTPASSAATTPRRRTAAATARTCSRWATRRSCAAASSTSSWRSARPCARMIVTSRRCCWTARAALSSAS